MSQPPIQDDHHEAQSVRHSSPVPRRSTQCSIQRLLHCLHPASDRWRLPRPDRQMWISLWCGVIHGRSRWHPCESRTWGGPLRQWAARIRRFSGPAQIVLRNFRWGIGAECDFATCEQLNEIWWWLIAINLGAARNLFIQILNAKYQPELSCFVFLTGLFNRNNKKLPP